jgi:hypothetical protein
MGSTGLWCIKDLDTHYQRDAIDAHEPIGIDFFGSQIRYKGRELRDDGEPKSITV